MVRREAVTAAWEWWIKVITLLMHVLIMGIFFCATWWWRPRWVYAAWVPSFVRDRLSQPSNTDAYREVFFARYALTTFILILAILWILTWFRGIRKLVYDGRMWWLFSFGMLLVWIFLSIRPDIVVNVAVARSQAAQWVLVFIFVVVVSCNGPSPRMISFALVGGMVFHAVIGIAQVGLQHEIGVAWIDEHLLKVGINIFELRLNPEVSGVSVIQSEDVRFLRAYGLTAHPNLLAGGLVMGLLAGLWMWRQPEWQRLAAWTTTIGLWGLFLTFSRASVGGLLVGSVVVFAAWWMTDFCRRELVSSGLRFGVVVLLVGGTFYMVYRPLVDVRAGSGNEGETSLEQMSVQARQIYKEQAKIMIRDNMWRGVGIGNFPWESFHMLRDDPRGLDLQGDHVHNIYYLAVAELGVIGGGLVSTTLAVAAIIVGLRWRKKQLSSESIALGGGVLAWLAIGWFEFFSWSLFTHQVIFWGVMAAVLMPSEKGNEDENGSYQLKQ